MNDHRHDENNRWERNLAEAAKGFNEPPETPRERMWDRIAAARQEQHEAVPTPAPAPWWTRRQVLWPAAVAAALVIGLGLGRLGRQDLAAPSLVDGSATVAMAPTSVPEETSQRPDPYQLAAQPVLARTETLLMQVKSGADDPGGESFSQRAVGLLGQTRLLLNSPAAEDPALKQLLEDLEIALARTVRVTAGPHPVAQNDSERQTLEDGLVRKAILPRLREQLTSGPTTVGL